MVENQKGCFLNRKKRTSEKFVNFIIDDTFNVLSELETYGAVLVYFYLCSLIPHTYDGKLNTDYKTIASKPYELSPQAIKNAYGKHSINTYRDGINKLIEKGFLKKITDNLYQFDDIPLQYRVKTYDEKVQMDSITAEEAFKIMKKEQLQQEIKEEQKIHEKYEWED